MYWLKLLICVAWDLFDFTVGRFVFMAPAAGELIGAGIATALFGWRGLAYLVELADPTEQIDGFVPMATLIALSAYPDHRQKRIEKRAAGA